MFINEIVKVAPVVPVMVVERIEDAVPLARALFAEVTSDVQLF